MKITIVALSLSAGLFSALAQPIPVPNGSFERESGAGQPFGVNINIAEWDKNPRPAYFPEGGFNGFFWVQTVGVFVDSNPYGNRDGAQAGYVLPFAGAGISQELSSLDAIYEPGEAYNFTLGVFGKGASNGILQLSFFYQDQNNTPVAVGTPTTIVYSEAAFPQTPSLNFIDHSVETPVVQSTDPWAGRPIGLRIDSIFGEGVGNWDYDNARLTAVPEPGTVAMLAVGLGGVWFVTRRRR